MIPGGQGGGGYQYQLVNRQNCLLSQLRRQPALRPCASPENGAKINSMEPESGSRSGFSLKRSAGLVVAVSVVAILLIALPAYRWFFLISFLIGY